MYLLLLQLFIITQLSHSSNGFGARMVDDTARLTAHTNDTQPKSPNAIVSALSIIPSI